LYSLCRTIVNPYQFSPFQEYPSLPSRNALYVVAGVRHVGDSRGTGDDWYTEITAFSGTSSQPM